MTDLGALEGQYLVAATVFQAILIAHFALRRWRLTAAARHGWLVYAVSLPFAVFSVAQLAAGAPWWLWLGGFLYLAWAMFGFVVEYRLRLQWRDPIRWAVFGPYVALYLAASMFYWWPAARLGLAAWLLLGLCFAVSTVLNVTSHRADPATA